MRLKHHSRALRRKKERGNVVAYTVLSTFFLFLAVGLGVDLSRLYLVKTELQNAADAGALAGGYALGEIADSPSSRITTAVTRAVNTMNLNKYSFDNKTFVSVMSLPSQRNLVTLAKNLNGTYLSEAAAQALSDTEKLKLRFIKVATPPVPIKSFFAFTIMGTLSLDAKATAGMSVPGNVRFCPAPIAAIAPDPGKAFPPEFQSHCPNGLTPFDDDNDPATPNCDPTLKFCKKCWYTIKQAPPGKKGSSPSPGNFGTLDCGGGGANALEDNLASYGSTCKCGNKSPGDTVAVDTKTGESTGPVQVGLNTRFNIYSNGSHPQYTDAPPDLNVNQETLPLGMTYTQYKAGSPMLDPQTQPGGHVGVANRRVLVIPMIAVSDWPKGSGSAKVSSMGGFFLKRAVDGNGDINAEYIGDDIVNVVGYDPNSPVNSNITTIVLYR
nr:Von Willebrand factor type A domain protein [uncultured bacterium]